MSPHKWRGLPKEGHYYHCTHNTLSYHNSSHREMLQSTNRLRSHHIITQVFYLQKIEDCYKTPTQPTTAKLHTADGSPMSAIGTTALHLRIAKFKFTHNFIICDHLPKTELIFGIDIQRNSHYHMHGTRKETATYKGKEIS